jgi:hypothetical protein
MTEEEKPAVTDSRFAGFNPEVEESHAAAAAAAAPAAAQATAPAEAKPAAPRKPYEIIVDFMHQVSLLHGNHPELRKLLDELESL